MLTSIRRARIGSSGLTLVEVIIAMALVAIVVSILFPVVFFAEKRMLENRNKMTAKAISEKQLEAIRSSITPDNYFSSLPAGDYGPVLLASGATLTLQAYDGSTDGNPVSADGTLNYSGDGTKFYVKTTIAWVDDPADGTEEGLGSNHDDMPFDYKELVIRVSTNSVFTNAEVTRADFKTLMAMEGGEEPYSGIIVRVVRGWPAGIDDADREPVFGAAVRLAETAPSSPTDSSAWDGEMSYTTNSKGEAIIPIDPDTFGSQTTRDFWVRVDYSGFIEDPAQVRNADWRKVTITRFVTSTDYRRIEEPCTLTLAFNGAQLDDNHPVWDGEHQDWNVKLEPAANLPPGDDGVRLISPGDTGLTYYNLWPSGTAAQYTATVNLKAWEDGFDSEDGWTAWKADRSQIDIDGTVHYNLWDYSSGTWFAAPGIDPRMRSTPPASDLLWTWYGYGENRLMSTTIPSANFIPMGKFAPADLPVAGQSPINALRGVMLSWDQNLVNSTSPGSFCMLYAGLNPADDAGVDTASSPDLNSLWRPVATLDILQATTNTSASHKEIKLDVINGTAINNMFADNYRLRFDSNYDVGVFTLDNLVIRCQYQKNFYFNGPGESISYTVTR